MTQAGELAPPESARAALRVRARSIAAPAAYLAISGIGCVLLGFLPDSHHRVVQFSHWALPIVLASLLVALAGAVLVFRERVRGAVRLDDLICLAVLAAIVVAYVLAVPAMMRIQADEYLVGGVSLGIWSGALPLLPTSGLYGPEGNFVPLDAMMDKRGVLLPLLAGILHFVRGFDLGNAYAVNAACTGIALAAIYVLVRQWRPPPTALLAACFCAAHPVLAWATRSIALEPLNLALVAVTCAVAVAALRRPTPARAVLLAWLAPLLAQARYESVVFSVIALALALVVLSRCPRHRGAAAMIGLVPFAFLPYAWQRAHVFAHGLESIGAEHAFGFDHFAAHLPVLLQFYLGRSPGNPLGVAFLLIGVAALAVGLPGRRARRVESAALGGSDGRAGVIGFAFGVLLVTGIVLTYAWGDLRTVVVLRLGLPVMMLAAVAAALMFHRVRTRLGAPAWMEPAAAALALAVAMPVAVRDETYGEMHAGPGLNTVQDWKRTLYPGCRFAFVNSAAPYFLLHGHTALTVGEVEAFWPMLEPRLQGIAPDALLVVQVADTLVGRLLEKNVVPRNAVARTVYEGPANGITSVRIATMDIPGRPLGPNPRPGCALPQPVP